MPDPPRTGQHLDCCTMISLGRYGASVRRVALLSRDTEAAAHCTPFVEVCRLESKVLDGPFLGRWLELIRDEGWVHLSFAKPAPAVYGGPNWESYGEIISNSTLETICEGLRNNSLRSLNLSNNRLGNDGAKALGEALRT
eukprot:Selendium_serpulae@DN6084_c2_g5_i1.p1